MKRALLVAPFLAAPLPCVAYGGWQSTEYAGMMEQLLPILMRGVLVTFVPYLVLSVWMERSGRQRVLPLAVAAAAFVAALVPSLNSMGERGPSELAVAFTGLAGLLLLLLLAAKFVVLTFRSSDAPSRDMSRVPEVPAAQE